jgi:fucose permease
MIEQKDKLVIRIIPLFFCLLGLITATWASRIAIVRDFLSLSPAILGAVLLSASVGAVLAYPIAAGAVLRYGFRRAILLAGCGLLLMLVGMTSANSVSVLMLCLFGYGMSLSCFDVAINTFASQLEKQKNSSVLAKLHAWFCVGAFIGAMVGALTVWGGISTLQHSGMIFLFAGVVLVMAFYFIPEVPVIAVTRTYFAVPHGQLMILGCICFCGAMIESTLTSWSGIFLRDQLGVSTAITPLAYGAISAGMLVMRFLGDRLKSYYGARQLVMWGTLLAMMSLLSVTIFTNLMLVLLAFVVTGVGVAMVFPFIFSAAGKHGAIALAGVATMGYVGCIIGPLMMGVIVQYVGLVFGLLWVGLLCLAVAMLARRALWLV